MFLYICDVFIDLLYVYKSHLNKAHECSVQECNDITCLSPRVMYAKISHILHVHVCLANINIGKFWDLRGAKRLILYILLCGVFHSLICFAL